MKERDPTAVLDDRARNAASELNRAAEARPVPELEPSLMRPEPEQRRRPLQRWLAVAAALVLIVGGIVVALALAGRETTTDQPPQPTTPTPLVPLILDGPVAGFEFAGAMEVTGPEADAPPRIRLDAYGPAGALPRLGIAVYPPSFEQGDFETGEQVTINGRTAFFHQVSGGSRALTLPARQGTITLMAPPGAVSPGREELIRVAERVRIADGELELCPDALPDDWGLLGSEPDLVGVAFPVTSGAIAGISAVEHYYVAYARAEEGLITASVVSGDEQRMHALVPLYATTTQVTVPRSRRTAADERGGAEHVGVQGAVVAGVRGHPRAAPRLRRQRRRTLRARREPPPGDGRRVGRARGPHRSAANRDRGRRRLGNVRDRG